MSDRTAQMRREQVAASEARPYILDRLRSGAGAAEIGVEVAARWSVDAAKAFRWAQYIEADFSVRRRRIAVGGLVCVWAGAVFAATGVLLRVFVPDATTWLVIGLAVGVPIAAAGLLVSVRAARLVRTVGV